MTTNEVAIPFRFYFSGDPALSGVFEAGATGSVTLTFTPGDGPMAGSEHERELQIESVITTAALPPTEAINGNAFSYAAGSDEHKTGLETVITVEECTDQALTNCGSLTSWVGVNSRAKTLSGIVPGTGASFSFLKIDYFDPFGSRSTEPLSFKVGTPPQASTSAVAETVTGGIAKRIQLKDIFTGEAGYTVTNSDTARSALSGDLSLDQSTTPPTVVIGSKAVGEYNLLYSGFQGGSTIPKTVPYQLVVKSAKEPSLKNALPSWRTKIDTVVGRTIIPQKLYNELVDIDVLTQESWITVRQEVEGVTVVAHPQRSDLEESGNGRGQYCVIARPTGFPTNTTLAKTECEFVEMIGLSYTQLFTFWASIISSSFLAARILWCCCPWTWNRSGAKLLKKHPTDNTTSIKCSKLGVTQVDVVYNNSVLDPKQDGDYYPIVGVAHNWVCRRMFPKGLTVSAAYSVPGVYEYRFKLPGGAIVHRETVTVNSVGGGMKGVEMMPISNGDEIHLTMS